MSSHACDILLPGESPHPNDLSTGSWIYSITDLVLLKRVKFTPADNQTCHQSIASHGCGMSSVKKVYIRNCIMHYRTNKCIQYLTNLIQHLIIHTTSKKICVCVCVGGGVRLFRAVMYVTLMRQTFRNCDLNKGCIYMQQPFMHNRMWRHCYGWWQIYFWHWQWTRVQVECQLSKNNLKHNACIKAVS